MARADTRVSLVKENPEVERSCDHSDRWALRLCNVQMNSGPRNMRGLGFVRLTLRDTDAHSDRSDRASSQIPRRQQGTSLGVKRSGCSHSSWSSSFMALINIASIVPNGCSTRVPADQTAAETMHSRGYVGDFSQAHKRRSSSSSLERNAVSEGEVRPNRVAQARQDWRDLWIRSQSVWAVLDLERLCVRKADVHGLASDDIAGHESRGETQTGRGRAPVRAGE